jgi:hypothetical protein
MRESTQTYRDLIINFQSSSYPSQEPTTMPTNISLPAQEGSTTTNSSDPSNWYDYWRSSSRPTLRPTQLPTYYPTSEPSLDPDGPTAYPTQAPKVSKSSSNGQSYELLSSMTALIFIGIIAAALYATRRQLGRKKKSKNKVVIRSPFFSELSKRVKERKKLMEEYFAVDAAECNILNHRSAASSIDLQISTEFIDISRENQQSIY